MFATIYYKLVVFVNFICLIVTKNLTVLSIVSVINFVKARLPQKSFNNLFKIISKLLQKNFLGVFKFFDL